jgi:hypothetical protein
MKVTDNANADVDGDFTAEHPARNGTELDGGGSRHFWGSGIGSRTAAVAGMGDCGTRFPKDTP